MLLLSTSNDNERWGIVGYSPRRFLVLVRTARAFVCVCVCVLCLRLYLSSTVIQYPIFHVVVSIVYHPLLYGIIMIKRFIRCINRHAVLVVYVSIHLLKGIHVVLVVVGVDNPFVFIQLHLVLPPMI